MGLISVMYHHVNSDRCSNDLEIFKKHLLYIKNNFTTIFPGEKVGKNSICLTFDDAYADFYFLVFPLLKALNLKATLAVPTKFILDETKVLPKDRMSFEHNELLKNYQNATLCTFTELREMSSSGLVSIASHSHSHVVLTDLGVDLALEIEGSKRILESKLNVNIDSFFFPFGKYDTKVLELVKKHYKYAFRIGNATHRDFSGINGVIYRVKGDGLKTEDEIFKPLKLIKYKFKGLLKQVSTDERDG